MRLALWLLLSILVSSCKGHLPGRPEVDICMVSAPDNGCLCSKADGSANYFLTWAECDKHVAISVDQFQAISNYIIEVERIAAGKGCRLYGPSATESLRNLSDRYTLLLRGR